MLGQKLMAVIWPAFLAACVLELLVFAVVDPGDLVWAGHPLAVSRSGVYTAAFFLFWVISMVSCWLTTLLRATPAEINACPFDPSMRPPGCPGKAVR